MPAIRKVRSEGPVHATEVVADAECSAQGLHASSTLARLSAHEIWELTDRSLPLSADAGVALHGAALTGDVRLRGDAAVVRRGALARGARRTHTIVALHAAALAGDLRLRGDTAEVRRGALACGARRTHTIVALHAAALTGDLRL